MSVLGAFGASGLGAFVETALGARGDPGSVLLGTGSVQFAGRGDVHPALCALSAGTDCVIDLFLPSVGVGDRLGQFLVVGRTSGNTMLFPMRTVATNPWCVPSDGVNTIYGAYNVGSGGGQDQVAVIYTNDGAQTPGFGGLCGTSNWGWTFSETVDIYAA